MTKQTGFTLIEVMIVVVIVAILSAIAVPSYNDYVRRGRIPQATSALASWRVQMEQYFQDNRKYDGGPAAPTNADSTYFDFASSNVTASTYTLTATGKGAMTGFSYSVDQRNTRSSSVSGVSGWSGSTNCWVTNKGGIC